MTLQRTPNVLIEVRYVADCPHVNPTLAILRRCLAQLGVEVPIVKREGDYASPTVLVDGRDVMGESSLPNGAACRCDLPTEDRVLDALRVALRKGPA